MIVICDAQGVLVEMTMTLVIMKVLIMMMIMIMMMMMVVVVERGRMLGWLVSCGARPVKMIGLLPAGGQRSAYY